MNEGNHSVVSEFFLLGLTSSREIQIFLFLFFTVFYVASMLGNILIVLTIISDHRLHFPMYFLLANLSFIDTGVSSIATPKMIYDLFRKHKVISLKGCITQMFFIHTVGGTEMVLLIVMAYDRYIAICKPLYYPNIMSLRMCTSFTAVAWTIGLIHSMAQLAFVVNLPLCGPNKIDSFYCDVPRFIKLACTYTYRLEFLVTANSGFISMGTFFILIVSYIFILVTVRRYSSAGLSRALSTLTAHITVVVFFFGPCIIVYVWPFPTLPIDKILAIFDALITPFMNPVIYTFRNKDIR
ncbi:olfactory receptor 4F3/4F16/4F29-like [Saimiri boliviensis]|nr:olfactory receptor 4F3/4F16/4F29-like [Saimiri boliviensis boliviensis]